MIDPRGPRYAAWVTALFWKALRSRQSLRRTPPAELEDAAPLRFAQLGCELYLLIARLPIVRLLIARLKVESTTNREGATA